MKHYNKTEIYLLQRLYRMYIFQLSHRTVNLAANIGKSYDICMSAPLFMCVRYISSQYRHGTADTAHSTTNDNMHGACLHRDSQ